MTAYAWPALYALFVWWFSTGLILFLDGLPKPTYRWTMAAATALAVAALFGLAASSGQDTVAGAFVAFTCALTVWAWHEVAFLMGFVTGPRQTACPPGTTGRHRFRLAVAAILHHELAIAATALLVVSLTWNGANPVGAWTFLLLWAMRLSAKLNLFQGVPNLAETLLPDQLRYLASYMRRRPPGQLFALTVSAASGATALLAWAAFTADPGTAAATGLTFLTTMAALAVLEHWLMVIPLPDTALWGWALKSREQPRRPAAPPPMKLLPAQIQPALAIDRRRP